MKINAHYKIIYLNINSLLPKIDELFLIGKFIKTDITGISGDSNRQLHFLVG